MTPAATSSGNILKFEDVSLHFGDAPAMEHVSFELAPGDTRVVYGVAGAGKTSRPRSNSQRIARSLGTIRFGTLV